MTALQIASGISKIKRRFYFEKDIISLPAKNQERAQLARKHSVFIEEEMSIVHLDLGIREDDDVEYRTNFLKGEVISWFELSLHQDVQRTKTSSLSEDVKSALESRRLALDKFVSFSWIWRNHHCTAYCLGSTYCLSNSLTSQISHSTVSRLQMLRDICSKPILIIVEIADVSEESIQVLFASAKAEIFPLYFW